MFPFTFSLAPQWSHTFLNSRIANVKVEAAFPIFD